MSTRWWFVCVAFFVATGARADLDKRDAAFEKKVDAELAAIDATLVPTFDAATNEMDHGDSTAAARDFEAVLARAPTFTPAMRRLCYVRIGQKRFEDAIAQCRTAAKAQPDPENQAALANALLADPAATEAARREASEYAQAAAQQDPNNVFAQSARCDAAVALGYPRELDECSAKLVALAPNIPESHVFAALAKGGAGDLAGGERELERARELGLDPATYTKLHAMFDEAQPLYVKMFRAIAPPLALWVFGLVFLFVAGTALSKLTLRALRTPRAKDARPTGGERTLRRAYRSVVTLGALYFYVSIPIVALLVVAFAGGLVILSLMVGQVPIKLLLIVCLVALYTLVAIARSLTMRIKDEAPGEKLDLATEPKLRAVLEEAARNVHTRPVDSVYLVPDAALAVTERGGFFAQMRGKAERVLILGVGALDGFEVRPFKAVLAHEYGHFQNEDTAGGGLALAARRALRSMALHMAMRGVATWYNPAWWFVRMYWAIYLRISQGASRLQEVLADRWAVLSYGTEPFIRGLRHVVARTIAFDAHANVTIKEVVAKKQPLANLYQHSAEKPASDESLAKALDDAWNRPPSDYDSHPRPADREQWARALDASGVPSAEGDGELAWSLFSNRAAIETLMTARIRKSVAESHNIRIADA